MSKDTYIHILSFDLKMRNWPRHGALISIMSRKWRDAARDDFPSLSFPLYDLYVFSDIWHRLNLEIAPSKNATSLQWYRTLSALWARLSWFCFGPLSLHLLKFQRVHVRRRKRSSIEIFLFKFQIFIILWAEGNCCIDVFAEFYWLCPWRRIVRSQFYWVSRSK